MMIGIAVLIATNPAVADAHSFDLIGVAIVDDWLAPAFLTVGVVRMAALVANGNWPVYGPWSRWHFAGRVDLVADVLVARPPRSPVARYPDLCGPDRDRVVLNLSGDAGHHGRYQR
jgi:hypothetical protein